MTDTPQPHPPLNPDLLFQQAVAHHQAGQLQEAEHLYQAILQIRQNHPDANHNLGVLMAQTGRHAAGLPYLKAALEADPSQGQHWLSYADALLVSGQATEALIVIQTAVQSGLDTTGVQTLLQKIEAAVRGGHATRTTEASDRINQPQTKTDGISPSELPQAENSQLVALFNAGRFTELEIRTRLLLESYPDSGFAWKVLGVALQMQGKEGLLPLQRAAELLPDDAEAHSNLGCILSESGRLTEAEISLRRAIKLSPDYTEAYSGLGDALRKQGRLSEAETSYRRALEIKPDHAETHNNLGVTLHDLCRLDEAEASYRRALGIKPGFAEAHFDLANVFSALARGPEAAAHYEAALKLRPDYPAAHFNFANLLSDLGRPTDSLPHYRAAIDQRPNYPEAFNNLGGALLDLGRTGEAITAYESALRLRPDFSDARENLARLRAAAR